MALVDHYIVFMNGAYKTVGENGNVSDWQGGITLNLRHRSSKTKSGFTENSVFSIDLVSQFPVEDLLSRDVYRNISIPLDIVPNIKEQAGSSSSGALFSTNDSFYIYGSGTSPLLGGDDPPQATRHTVASYNMNSDAWNSVKPSGGDFNGDARLWGQTASDPVTGMSYFTGGANNVQGMLEFNASDPSHVTWANITQGNGIDDSGPIVIAGGMVFLPFGEAGVLLLLGGANVRVSNLSLQLSY